MILIAVKTVNKWIKKEIMSEKAQYAKIYNENFKFINIF